MRRHLILAVAFGLAAGAPAQAQTGKAQTGKVPSAGKPQAGLLPGSRSDAPVEIDAKNLQWRDAERMAEYAGDVVVVQGEATLRASRLRLYLAKGSGDAAGALAAASGSADIRRAEADGPVTVIQKDQIAAGDAGVYDKAQGLVTLTGREVVVTQGQNVASGAKLVYSLADRNVSLFGDKGKVRTHLVQEQPAGAARPASAKPAAPSGDGLLPGGSSREPVQVEARRLDWRDATQTATYAGDVTAVQGEGAMRASKLVVYVERDPRSRRPSAGPTGGGRVRRMEASGPVTLIQKDQVATGARAVYDKAANRVELIGNVTLTQGPNVTTGERLVYDLTTKQAVMTAGAGRAQAQFTPGSAPEAGAPAGAGKRR